VRLIDQSYERAGGPSTRRAGHGKAQLRGGRDGRLPRGPPGKSRAAFPPPLRRPGVHPPPLWPPPPTQQLAFSRKSGTNRNNCALSRRNWTGAKKRSVKSVRLICSMIHRLNPMKDKNRIAAAKQVYDSRVRHFSNATNFSSAFQNVR